METTLWLQGPNHPVSYQTTPLLHRFTLRYPSEPSLDTLVRVRRCAVMANYFEIDFLSVEAKKSGDAITVRYEIDGLTYIHVVDAGFQSSGDKVAQHIRTYYSNPTYIDHVVATHQDGDHAGGLRTILQEFDVGALWLHRPWLYAQEIIHRFATYESVPHLERRLRTIYPNLAALEEIAIERGIPIHEPFQGAQIGAFAVMAPSKARFLELIVESDKTPESIEEAEEGLFGKATTAVLAVAARVMTFVAAAWGAETFSPNETSNENEMSVVQYANLCGEKILLTGDTGRGGLQEAAAYAPYVGLSLPGIDRMQVPHHGSRRNVSTELLDRWIGPRLAAPALPGQETVTAIISSALEDTHHPRKSVIRAFVHRGGRVFATEGQAIRTQCNAPARAGWTALTPIAYPHEQEE